MRREEFAFGDEKRREEFAFGEREEFSRAESLDEKKRISSLSPKAKRLAGSLGEGSLSVTQAFARRRTAFLRFLTVHF